MVGDVKTLPNQPPGCSRGNDFPYYSAGGRRGGLGKLGTGQVPVLNLHPPGSIGEPPCPLTIKLLTLLPSCTPHCGANWAGIPSDDGSATRLPAIVWSGVVNSTLPERPRVPLAVMGVLLRTWTAWKCSLWPPSA